MQNCLNFNSSCFAFEFSKTHAYAGARVLVVVVLGFDTVGATLKILFRQLLLVVGVVGVGLYVVPKKTDQVVKAVAQFVPDDESQATVVHVTREVDVEVDALQYSW